MELTLGEYQPVPIKTFPGREQEETAEDRYWGRFKAAITTTEVEFQSFFKPTKLAAHRQMFKEKQLFVQGASFTVLNCCSHRSCFPRPRLIIFYRYKTKFKTGDSLAV